MVMRQTLGIVSFSNGKIEIEIGDNDIETFTELEKILDGEITWLKHDLKILVVPEVKVVIKATDLSAEVIDQHCLERG